jgi:hypothetical protein
MEDYKELHEELMAAFLEGKTDSEDSLAVLNAMVNDNDVIEILTDASVIDDIDIIAMHDGDYGYLELGIEPVFTTEELIDMSSHNIDTIRFDDYDQFVLNGLSSEEILLYDDYNFDLTDSFSEENDSLSIDDDEFDDTTHDLDNL